MTDRTDDDILNMGPRDWTEAERVQQMLCQAVQRAMMSDHAVELDYHVHCAKRLLDLIPMVAMLRNSEARRREGEVKPLYVKLDERSEVMRQVLKGTIPRHEG